VSEEQLQRANKQTHNPNVLAHSVTGSLDWGEVDQASFNGELYSEGLPGLRQEAQYMSCLSL
jgi:hypothetical protein